MFAYWLMYFLPLLVLASRQAAVGTEYFDRAWLVLCIFFVFLIGMRFEVGGDWSTYLDHFDSIVGKSFAETLLEYDPGYALFEWVSATFGWGIYGVNIACGVLVMTGVYQFCRQQSQPWLALTVAVPYLIIVVAMGYTRQSAALGLELIALVALANGQLVRYAIWILLAISFHKTAVVLLPLALIATSYKNIWTSRLLLAATFLAMALLGGWATFSEESDKLITNYIEAEMISDGATIRVVMNALPAAIFLLFAKNLAPDEVERRTWILLSLLSLGCVPLLDIASTATDRIALYLIPVQLFVYSRIGATFYSEKSRALANRIIVAGYAVVLFVLLNYASIVSVYWVPYQNAAFL
jgi:hypothetical protein